MGLVGWGQGKDCTGRVVGVEGGHRGPGAVGAQDYRGLEAEGAQDYRGPGAEGALGYRGPGAVGGQ